MCISECLTQEGTHTRTHTHTHIHGQETFSHLVYCGDGSGDFEGKSDPQFERGQKKNKGNVLPYTE